MTELSESLIQGLLQEETREQSFKSLTEANQSILITIAHFQPIGEIQIMLFLPFIEPQQITNSLQSLDNLGLLRKERGAYSFGPKRSFDLKDYCKALRIDPDKKNLRDAFRSRIQSYLEEILKFQGKVLNLYGLSEEDPSEFALYESESIVESLIDYQEFPD